jgi:transposase
VRVNKVVRLALGLVDTVVLGAFLDFRTGDLVVSVRAWQRASSRCGICGEKCPGYDGKSKPRSRRWRSLDLGMLRVYLEAKIRRVQCPDHGVVVEQVPWARHHAGHTRHFDQQVAWLVKTTSKSTVAHLMRVVWRTVGAIVKRVRDDLEVHAGDRLAGIRRIGIDEISYKRRHKYLVVVVDHDTGRVLWLHPGRTKQTLGKFFNELGEERCQQLELVSADGADWIAEMVGLRAPQAKRCMDPFHVVMWAMDALNTTRRAAFKQARAQGQKAQSALLGPGCQFALWKNPEDLTDRQKATLADIERTNEEVYRGYLIKEQLRAVFAAGGEAGCELLDRWMEWAATCDLPAFVDLADRMQWYVEEIKNSLVHGLSNARVESVNTKIRLLTRMAFGFKSVEELMALVMLHLGGYVLRLPGRAAA